MSAVEDLFVKLGRIRVRGHHRATLHGLVDVEGHWRTIADLSVLGGKLDAIDGGFRIRAHGVSFRITKPEGLDVWDVDDGTSKTEHKNLGEALSQVQMQVRSLKQLADARARSKPLGEAQVPAEWGRFESKYPPEPGARIGTSPPFVTYKRSKRVFPKRKKMWNMGAQTASYSDDDSGAGPALVELARKLESRG